MKRVIVAGRDRPLSEVTPSWLREEIETRRDSGLLVCVQFQMQEGDVDLAFGTPACAHGSGGRPARPHEREIIQLWDKHGLNQDDFGVGQLIAFLSKAKNF